MSRLKMNLLVALLLIVVAGTDRTYAKPKEVTYELTCSARPEVRFDDLPCGVFVSTKCEADHSRIYDPSEMSAKMQKKMAKLVTFRFTPEVGEFFNDIFRKYVRNTGIIAGSDRNTDFYLRAKLLEYKLKDNIGSAKCSAIIEWELANPQNKVVMDGTARGSYTMAPGQNVADALDKAMTRCLEDIDWAGIAWEIKRSGETKRADQEKQKQVTGDGDTALEHTVIRWYIVSAPAGADVSWRVVSSTPDVKNTNASYVGTTPYETTETFDIRGLKWENSGNVQIEVTCEKPGYITQRRRFNLRQAIEQREISAKFNLVKESEATE